MKNSWPGRLLIVDDNELNRASVMARLQLETGRSSGIRLARRRGRGIVGRRVGVAGVRATRVAQETSVWGKPES